jgi:hypothetical protein
MEAINPSFYRILKLTEETTSFALRQAGRCSAARQYVISATRFGLF